MEWVENVIILSHYLDAMMCAHLLPDDQLNVLEMGKPGRASGC